MQKTPQTIPLYIGGTFSGASDGRTFERLGPASNALVTRAAAATLADADAAVEAAAGAFAAWSALGPSVRRTRLLKAADALEARIPDFIEAGVAETGATADWMGFNASYAANMMREAASLSTQVSGTVVASDLSDAMTLSVRRPCGVVLGIAPWNSPVILAVRAIATALACGNTVVLKASEVCPATHALVGRAMHEAGLGDGVVNVLTNAPADAPALVERLIAAPAVRRVNFTGSAAVGRIIAHHAAEHLKPSLLELGSKAPLLVLDDADVDAAVAAIAFGAFLNQGQICMSTERVVVADAVADELVAKLASKARSLKAGPPGTPGAVLGLLESARSAQRVQALVINAMELGAELPLDLAVEGACMQPCIVDRVDSRMRLYGEESFGPVVSIIRVANDDEAIRVANDSAYGLTAAVFSRDTSRAMRVARSLQSGACHINGATLYDEPQLPMGGVKASGWGRFGGPAGIHEFTDLCSVTLQSGRQKYPI